MKKRISMFCLFLLIVIVLSVPGSLGAHGTGHRVLEQNRAIVLECYYSDGSAINYAETRVLSPEQQEVEHQNGRTDSNGRFAFLPDSSGVWKIEVNDGIGHKIKAQVMVDLESKAQIKTDKSEFKKESKCLKVCLGISLIFNLCCIVLVNQRD